MTTVNVRDELLLKWKEATDKKREEFPVFVNEQVERGIEEIERGRQKI